VAASWTLGVARTDLAQTTLVEGSVPAITDGEALLRVDRVGMTANNVTYALLGDTLGYWRFFPPQSRGLEPQWGLVPLWGFADVVESAADGVNAGMRLFGYLPPATHLVVRPDRLDEQGFRDASEHRADLPSVYNGYVITASDPAYQPEREDLLILFRPLFLTSFVLADQLEDTGYAGAETVVVSSASSKTSYGTAFLLHGRGPRLVGLTSSANVEFARTLGCYDAVLSYDEIAALEPDRPTVYVDVAGDVNTRAGLAGHLGDRLVRDVLVGFSHQDADVATGREVFFAPTQIRKRAQEWGRDGLDQRFGAAWRRFAPVAASWVDVAVGTGPEGLRAAWLEVLAGRTPPSTGHVVAL
jgi:hypothetical protein